MAYRQPTVESVAESVDDLSEQCIDLAEPGPATVPLSEAAPELQSSHKEQQQTARSSAVSPYVADDTLPSATIHDLAMRCAATSKLSTIANEALLSLYIDGRDGLVGWLELANVTTRDKLFEIVQHELEDDLDDGDVFDIVRFQRVDGEAFPRVNERTVPIKQSGSKAMWTRLVEIMSENGVGDVKGYVVVKKAVGTQ
jgi:hypothetical protein